MKKFSKTKATGKLGVTYVANIVFDAGSIFREVPEDTDLGVDGYIEFVEEEIATGALVGVQIKAGSSYLVQRGDAQYFQVSASRADFDYWNKQPVPVALIAHEPQTTLSGWLDISDYIRRHPEALLQDNTVLHIHSKAKPFTKDTFQAEFQATFRAYGFEADLFNLADLVASHDHEDKFQGVLGLISHEASRFSKLTCFLLLRHLFHRDNKLRAAVSDVLSRYLSHPEVGYYPPEEIGSYVKSALEDFGCQEIGQLLDTALLDENMFRRGSMSQSVGVIIANVPRHEQYLYELASDSSQPYEIRAAAIGLAGEFGISPTIELIARNFDLIEWGDVYDHAQWAAELYPGFSYSYDCDLSSVIERHGFDANQLADILRDASLAFLVENRYFVEQILVHSTNPYVRYEASRAQNKVA